MPLGRAEIGQVMPRRHAPSVVLATAVRTSKTVQRMATSETRTAATSPGNGNCSQRGSATAAAAGGAPIGRVTRRQRTPGIVSTSTSSARCAAWNARMLSYAVSNAAALSVSSRGSGSACRGRTGGSAAGAAEQTAFMLWGRRAHRASKVAS